MDEERFLKMSREYNFSHLNPFDSKNEGTEAAIGTEHVSNGHHPTQVDTRNFLHRTSGGTTNLGCATPPLIPTEHNALRELVPDHLNSAPEVQKVKEKLGKLKMAFTT